MIHFVQFQNIKKSPQPCGFRLILGFQRKWSRGESNPPTIQYSCGFRRLLSTNYQLKKRHPLSSELFIRFSFNRDGPKLTAPAVKGDKIKIVSYIFLEYFRQIHPSMFPTLPHPSHSWVILRTMRFGRG